MHRIWAGALVAALALTLAIAGCGGDDSLTRAELVREASTICRQANRATLQALRDAQRDAQRENRNEVSDARGPIYAKLVTKVAEVRQTAADDLDELVPPEELSAAYDRFVAARHAGAELLPSEDEATRGDDPDAKKRNAQEATANEAARRLKIRC
jgi:hypothetical protein